MTAKMFRPRIEDMLAGPAGVNAWPTAAAAGDAKSVAAVLRYIQNQLMGADGTFNPRLGYRVLKTENINTATGVDLFTVTGKVLISAWFGEVTNAFGTGVTDYKLRVKTANSDLCAATNLASAAVGYMWSLSNDAGLTLLTGSSYAVSVTTTADNNAIGMADRVVGLAGGSCTLQSNRTAGDSGDSLNHSLWYWPLEPSAAVVAA